MVKLAQAGGELSRCLDEGGLLLLVLCTYSHTDCKYNH